MSLSGIIQTIDYDSKFLYPPPLKRELGDEWLEAGRQGVGAGRRGGGSWETGDGRKNVLVEGRVGDGRRYPFPLPLSTP